MTNKLYVVSTPIGNLSEFTPRAIEVLKSVDFIACEDTRVTRKLCNLFEIDKPLFSCHEHNEFTVHQKIIKAIKDGKVVALVSDAGYPGISDPGSILIRKCIENSIDIEVISGPCALINALVSSGLDTTHFYYYGFLPSKKSERKKELKLLALREETMIFYEAPHRIVDTLEDMLDSFGERQISLSRELTKKHEQHIRGTISDVLSKLNEDNTRGEMVLCVSGHIKEEITVSDIDIIESIDKLISQGVSAKDAIKSVAEKYSLGKNEVYKLYHQ